MAKQNGKTRSTPATRPIVFHMCVDTPCKDWPRHAYLQIGMHPCDTRSTPVAFSQMTLLKGLRGPVKAKMVSAADAERVRRQIRASGLNEKSTRADRFVRNMPDRFAPPDHFLNILFGLVSEEDSGPLRAEACSGVCGHPRCAEYPRHVHLFLGGLRRPFSNPMFSTATAKLAAKEACRIGLLDRAESARLKAQLKKLSLAIEETRADRLMRSGRDNVREIAERLFGLVPPEDGAKDARFEMCHDEQVPVAHGHLHDGWVSGHDGQALLSKMAARRALARNVKDGVIAAEEAPRITAQIEAAHLPDEHMLDGVATGNPPSLEQVLAFTSSLDPNRPRA